MATAHVVFFVIVKQFIPFVETSFFLSIKLYNKSWYLFEKEA